MLNSYIVEQYSLEHLSMITSIVQTQNSEFPAHLIFVHFQVTHTKMPVKELQLYQNITSFQLIFKDFDQRHRTATL